MGGSLKNIETPEEQSACGLHSMDGILVMNIKDRSKLASSGMTDGDVIVGLEGEKVKNISELLIKYQEKLFHGSLKLSIVRNQKEREVLVELQ